MTELIFQDLTPFQDPRWLIKRGRANDRTDISRPDPFSTFDLYRFKICHGSGVGSRFGYASILVVVYLLSFSCVAAEMSACDLIDKETAAQIFGRPVERGPAASKHVLPDKVKSHCNFGAAGAPITGVTITVSEFKSSAEAKAWADQAKTQRDPGGRVETEKMIGNEAIWWSQTHAAGYVVQKNSRVLELYIRGVAAGSEPFRVTPSMRPQLRRAALRAMEKL